MLLGSNKPTFLKCLAHLAMTLLLLLSILLLLSLPTNQRLVPRKLRQSLGVYKEHTLAHLINLSIFLGLISRLFPTNRKIIVVIWAMMPFTVSPMPLLECQETKGLIFKFPSFLASFPAKIYFHVNIYSKYSMGS